MSVETRREPVFSSRTLFAFFGAVLLVVGVFALVGTPEATTPAEVMQSTELRSTSETDLASAGFADNSGIKGCHGSGPRQTELTRNGNTGWRKWCKHVSTKEACESSYIIVDKGGSKYSKSGWAAPCVWKYAPHASKAGGTSNCDAVYAETKACPPPVSLT
jgi:hypothetical protein